MTATTHIRKPWRRGFYTTSSDFVRRSPNNSEPETYCGAAVTDHDVTIADWRRATRKREQWGVCAGCQEASK